MVCGNVKLHDFIAQNVSSEKASEYKKSINEVREVSQSTDANNAKVLKKENDGKQASESASSSTTSKLPWTIVAGAVIVLLLAIQMVRRYRRKKNE